MINVDHSQNIGKKFGRLTICEVFPKGKYYYYGCICDCGNKLKVASFSVIKGTQVSCGCFHKERVSLTSKGRIPKSKTFDGTPSFSYLFNTYTRNARKREIEFSLTKEEFKALTKQTCGYCGQEPNRAVKYFTNKLKHKNPYLHNGIDRINNNKGYTLENSVACCRTCNVAKGTQTVEEFTAWINKVYKFNEKN